MWKRLWIFIGVVAACVAALSLKKRRSSKRAPAPPACGAPKVSSPPEIAPPNPALAAQRAMEAKTAPAETLATDAAVRAEAVSFSPGEAEPAPPACNTRTSPGDSSDE